MFFIKKSKKIIATSMIFMAASYSMSASSNNNHDVTPENPVIIGGAGIAGIAAAYELEKKGVPFIILEARHRIGGRMNKFTFGKDDDMTLERGANWIQGTVRNPIWDLKKKYQLKGERQNWDNYTVYDDQANQVFQAYFDHFDPAGAAADAAWLASWELSARCIQPATSADQTPADIRYCLEKFGPDYDLNDPNKYNLSNADLQEIATGFVATTALERLYEYWSQDFEFAQSPQVTSGATNIPSNSYSDFKDADFFVLDDRGYQWLVESLAAEYLLTDKSLTNNNKIVFDTQHPSSRLKLNQKITKVTYDNNLADGENSGVTIETCLTKSGQEGADFNNGWECVVPYQLQTYKGAYFIPTFSVGVLQQVNNDDANTNMTSDMRKDSSPEFIPQFPADMKAGIDNFAMAMYSKLFFQFPFNFWDGSEMIISAWGPDGLTELEKGEYAPIWQSLDLPNKNSWKPGSNALFVTVTGERAKQFQNMGIEQGKLAAKTQMIEVLNTLYKDEIKAQCAQNAGACEGGTQLTISDITDFSMTRWLANPLYRGTYSNWSNGRTPTDQANYITPQGNLWMSGEATCSRYNGYTHGGMLSGMRTARNLLNHALGFTDVDTTSTCDQAPEPGNNPNGPDHIVKARGLGGERPVE